MVNHVTKYPFHEMNTAMNRDDDKLLRCFCQKEELLLRYYVNLETFFVDYFILFYFVLNDLEVINQMIFLHKESAIYIYMNNIENIIASINKKENITNVKQLFKNKHFMSLVCNYF